MRISYLLYAKKSTNCYAFGLPMESRVKARVNVVGEEYIKAFWVGLLDGDGGIRTYFANEGTTVKDTIAIEQVYTPETELMHHAIASVIGGGVSIQRENKKIPCVLWQTSKLEVIESIIKIFDVYPCLTTRLNCRIAFLKKTLQKRAKYAKGECSKEELLAFVKAGQETIFDNRNRYWQTSYKDIPHFKPWLSGFIEAEGCWTNNTAIMEVGDKRKRRFHIDQTHDKFLMEFILEYCQANNSKVTESKRKPNHFIFEVVNRMSLKILHDHVHSYPLLGYKGTQFKRMFDSLRASKTKSINGQLILFPIPEDSLFMRIRKDEITYPNK